MNVKEAANVLGVHTNTVYAWIDEGRLAATKKGVSWDISEDVVKSIMKQQAGQAEKAAYLFVAHEAMRKELTQHAEEYRDERLRFFAEALIRAIDEKQEVDKAIENMTGAIQQFKAVQAAFEIVDKARLWETGEKGSLVENETEGDV